MEEQPDQASTPTKRKAPEPATATESSPGKAAVTPSKAALQAGKFMQHAHSPKCKTKVGKSAVVTRAKALTAKLRLEVQQARPKTDTPKRAM